MGLRLRQNFFRQMAIAVAIGLFGYSPDLFSADCEMSFVETRSHHAVASSKDGRAWMAATKALEKKVIEIVGKGPGGLYMPFCWEASLALKRLLQSEYGLKTTHVEALIASSFGDKPGTHYYLKVLNFFGNGDHLYIDPTLQQFGTNYVKPPIFVGSRSELERFIAERGALEGFPDFVRDYVAGKTLRTTH